MKKFTLSALTMLLAFSMYGQQQVRKYATMLTVYANKLKKEVPNQIEILGEKGHYSAVYMTEEAGYKLHDEISTHGAGYIHMSSKQEALNDIIKPYASPLRKSIEYTISEDAIVNVALKKVSKDNIARHIKELVDYGTRYHKSAKGTQAAEDLKAKWEAMAKAYNRDDVSVKLFKHRGTKMPSVILTIKGATNPDQTVIVGGHLDSINREDLEDAPGADDDASGIANITEAYRVLLETGFIPERNVEFIAYAAEEIGLVGSKEIANQYRKEEKDVIAVGQFDMTFYKNGPKDIYFVNDFVSTELTSFMKELIDHYNRGDITYAETRCGYECSDHASWTKNGYNAAFPFETPGNRCNKDIHTNKDTFDKGSIEHCVKFSKLCTEFIIEAAKGKSLSIDEFSQEGYNIKITNTDLKFKIDSSNPSITRISIYNILGKKVNHSLVSKRSGKISLKGLSNSTYIANFKLSNAKSFSKKFILK